MALHANVVNGAVLRNEIVSAAQMLHALDMEDGHEVVLVGEVTGAPYQTGRDGLRPHLGPELHSPMHAILVDDIEFGVAAVGVFLVEGECARGLVGFASGPVEQVTGSNI